MSPPRSELMVPGFPEGPYENPSEHKFTRAFDEVGNPHVWVDVDTLGGKGLKLAEMTQMGIRVPPGFTLTTYVWRFLVRERHTDIFSYAVDEVRDQLRLVEERTGRKLGDPDEPLFLSSRSGAKVSIPGGMNTELNLGLNDETIEALEREIGEEAAWRAYYVVMKSLSAHGFGLPEAMFAKFDQRMRQADSAGSIRRIIPELKVWLDPTSNHQLRAEALSGLSFFEHQEDLRLVELREAEQAGFDRAIERRNLFPQEPGEQIELAIRAIYRSWLSQEAEAQRKSYGLSDRAGTAVNIQQMVWGNSQREGAGSGVVFTQDPRDLEPFVCGFAAHQQGMAVVGDDPHSKYTLETLPLPIEVRQELGETGLRLQDHYRWPQDMEFTYDGEKLWWLQTRDVNLSPRALFLYLDERVDRGGLGEAEGLRLITPAKLQALLQPVLDSAAVEQARKAGQVEMGLPVALGVASGPAATSMNEAEAAADSVVLVLEVIKQVDLHQLPEKVVAVVAGNGGVGSHIALVAQGVGERRSLPVVFGVDTLTYMAGGLLTVDGSSGEVFRGEMPLSTDPDGSFLSLAQRDRVESWYRQRLAHPWEYLVPTEEGLIIDEYTDKAKNLLVEAKARFESPKAQVAYVVDGILPAEVRIPYEALHLTGDRARDEDNIKAAVDRALSRGGEATLRSCFAPDRKGKGPWKLIGTEAEIDRFLETEYPAWFENPDPLDELLTELLVGSIPKDKLNPDPKIQKQHCSFTVTASPQGEIVLTVCPHTSQLRQHEETDPSQFIVIRVSLDRSLKEVDKFPVFLTDAMWADEHARDQAIFVYMSLFFPFFRESELLHRLAALNQVFPHPQYSTAVLEGQARLPEWGHPDRQTLEYELEQMQNPAVATEKQWVKIYGAKIDKVDNGSTL